jgi:Ca2+-dependent lipid-binding protein
LNFFFLSVCDEPKVNSSSESQEKIYEKIHKLNDILNQLFQKWANNLSQLRELSVGIIQFNHSSLPNLSDQLDTTISQILITFQTGAIIHCGSFISFSISQILFLFVKILIRIIMINYVWNMN